MLMHLGRVKCNQWIQICIQWCIAKEIVENPISRRYGRSELSQNSSSQTFWQRRNAHRTVRIVRCQAYRRSARLALLSYTLLTIQCRTALYFHLDSNQVWYIFKLISYFIWTSTTHSSCIFFLEEINCI